eukprot:4854732-Prymnesium_polylepis.1
MPTYEPPHPQEARRDARRYGATTLLRLPTFTYRRPGHEIRRASCGCALKPRFVSADSSRLVVLVALLIRQRLTVPLQRFRIRSAQRRRRREPHAEASQQRFDGSGRELVAAHVLRARMAWWHRVSAQGGRRSRRGAWGKATAGPLFSSRAARHLAARLRRE